MKKDFITVVVSLIVSAPLMASALCKPLEPWPTNKVRVTEVKRENLRGMGIQGVNPANVVYAEPGDCIELALTVDSDEISVDGNKLVFHHPLFLANVRTEEGTEVKGGGKTVSEKTEWLLHWASRDGQDWRPFREMFDFDVSCVQVSEDGQLTLEVKLKMKEQPS